MNQQQTVHFRTAKWFEFAKTLSRLSSTGSEIINIYKVKEQNQYNNT